MPEYVGKILGDQRDCCEPNRRVLDIITDRDIVLVVECTVCGRKWNEVLD